MEVVGSYSIPPQLLRTAGFQGADINKLIKLKYYQAHNELISMAIMPVMSLLQIVWISLPRVFILLKCYHFGISRSFREICFEYSLMLRSSQLRLLNTGKVEIWTPGFYVTLKSMSVTFMDSMSMFIVHTLGLQLMRCERPLLIRLNLTRLLFLLLPESLWAKSGKNKIKSQETPSNWTY